MEGLNAARESEKSGADAPGETGIDVEIWLFGYLALVAGERHISLNFPDGISAGDVVRRLADRYGPEIRKNIFDDTGAKSRFCRIFLNGLPIETLDAPLEADAKQQALELILLSAYEGG